MKTKLFSLLAAMTLLAVSLSVSSCSDKEEKGLEVKFLNAVNGSITLPAGDTYDVKVNVMPDNKYYQVEFESSNPSVFVVNSYTGRVTGVKMGAGELIVKGVVNTDIYGKCPVTISDGPGVAVERIVVDPGYTDFMVYIPDELELGEYVHAYPEYAANPSLKYSISPQTFATIDETTGKITPITDGVATVTIETTDGTGLSVSCKATVTSVRPREYTNFDRAGWEVMTSFPTIDDSTIKGTAASLIDDPASSSCISMVKPGKSYGGVTVGANDEQSFTIDMKETKSFNYFQVHHRDDMTSVTHLWAWGFSVYISSNGTDFSKILDNISMPHASVNDKIYKQEIDQTYNARYVKFVLTQWNSGSGSCAQIRDLQIGTFVIK